MKSELEKIAHQYGDGCVKMKKQNKKQKKRLAKDLLVEYANNTTLHGLRYVADRTLNNVERFFWFLTVILSIVLCSVYIYNVVYKWKTSPVIVTMNEQLSSVGSVPFPAVTICPQMKINPKYYDFTGKQKMFSTNQNLRHGEDFLKFETVNTLCDYFYLLEKPTRPIMNSSVVEYITEVAPSIDDIFILCSWYNDSASNCSDIFRKVITEHGVCYTANSLATRDIFENAVQSDYLYMENNDSQIGWSMEEGYNYFYKHKYVYPRRGHGLQSNADLELILKEDPTKCDRNCNKIFSGYKLYLHHPADFPQTLLHYYDVAPNQLSSMAISFSKFDSDSDLIAYNIQTRQCYFPSERKLRYFKVYTISNCQAECLSNYTYNMCKCVGYYMPHDNSSEICNNAHDDAVDCMNDARIKMALHERSGNLDSNEGCRCLAACNSVEYNAELIKTNYDIRDIWDQLVGYDEYNSSLSYSKVHLVYKMPQFVTLRRRELFGFTEMLANIGGLLGVFLGFSFLSMIEILYFLTVRFGFILKGDFPKEYSEKK